VSPPRFYLPREHGGWALLLAPPMTGIAAAGGGATPAVLLLAGALLGAFLMRTPLGAVIRDPADRSAAAALLAYGVPGALCLLLLMYFYDRWLLALLAAPGLAALFLYTAFRIRRRSGYLVTELLAAAVLALGAPAAFYTAAGALTADAGWLWLLNALYFAGPIFYVRMILAWRAAFHDPDEVPYFRAVRRAACAYHAGAAACAAGLALMGAVPAPVVLPYFIAGAKLLRRLRRGPTATLKSVGWREVVHALIFTAVVAYAYAYARAVM